MKFASVLSFLAIAAPAFAMDQEKVVKLIPDQYIITFSADITRDPALEQEHYDWLERQITRLNARSAAGSYGVLHKYKIGASYKGYAAKVPKRLAELIQEMPNVSFIEQDEEISIVTVQRRPVPWGLSRIAARELPPINSNYTYPDKAGEGVFAYVIDTYVF